MDYKQKEKSEQVIKKETGAEKETKQQMQRTVMQTDWVRKEQQLKKSTFRLEDSVSFQSLKNRRVSQLLIENHRFRKDSAEMTAVKNALTAVDRFIHEKYEEKMTPDVIEEMKSAYNLAIDCCANYIEQRKPSTKAGQMRKKMVSDVMADMCGEMDRLEIIKDRVHDQTVGKYLFINLSSQVMQYKTEEKKAQPELTEKQKKALEEKEKLTKEQAAADMDLLEMKGDHLKLIEKKKVGGHKKIDSPYLRLIKILNAFPDSMNYAQTVEINGSKIQLLQKSDNTLYIVRNNQQFKMPQNVSLLKDLIETKVMENPLEYGSDNVAAVLDRLRPWDTIEDSDEKSRIRDISVHFLKKISGLPTDTFNNMSTDLIWGLGRQFAGKLQLSQEEIRQQLLVHVKEMNDNSMINGQETLEALHQSQVQKQAFAKAVVVAEDKKKKKEEEQKKPEWTETEEKIKDLAADIVYSSDTWVTDNEKEKPGARVQKMIMKHKDILGLLVADIYSKDKSSDSLLEETIKKMPMNAFVQTEEQADAIRGKMKDMIQGVRDFINEKIKDKVDDSIKGDDIFSNIGKATMRKGFEVGAKVPAMVSGRIADEFGDDEIDNEELSKFAELERKLDEGSTFVLDAVQTQVTEIAKDIFKQDKKAADNVQKPAEAKQQEKDKKEADNSSKELDRMLEEALKGDSGQGKFTSNVLQKYFAGVSVMDKRAMLASALRNAKPMNSDINDADAKEKAMANYMGGLLKGAGPLLQKMLQGFPVDSLPESIRGAITDMKSKLSPIPDEIVQAELFDMVKRSKGTVTQIKLHRSLGAASVGQAFLCTLYGPALGKEGKEVVIKLLRPDVRNKMMREKAIMLEAAKATDKGMIKTYEAQLKRILEEMDLTIEASNCEKGQLYNNDRGRVHSMKINKLIEPTVNSLVLEKAPGTTVDEYISTLRSTIEEIGKPFVVKKEGQKDNDENGPEIEINDSNITKVDETRNKLLDEIERLDKRRKCLANAASKWVEEGVFKAGYYHGDLHAGNMMIDDKAGLTIIDFGNVTVLKEQQQKEIIRMMMAATAGDVDGYLKGFHSLLEGTTEEFYQQHENELKAVFEKVLHLGGQNDAGKRIAVSLIEAQKLGFALPSSISTFSSSQLRLQNTMDELTNLRDKLDKLYKNIEKQMQKPEKVLTGNVDMKKFVNILTKSRKDVFTECILNRPPKEKEFLESLNRLDEKSMQSFIDYKFQDALFTKRPEKLLSQLAEIRKMQKDKNVSKDELTKKEKAFYYQYITEHTSDKKNSGIVTETVKNALQDQKQRKTFEEKLKPWSDQFPAVKDAYDKFCKEEARDASSKETILARCDFLWEYGQAVSNFEADSEYEISSADSSAAATGMLSKEAKRYNALREYNRDYINGSFPEAMAEVIGNNKMNSLFKIGGFDSIKYYFMIKNDTGTKKQTNQKDQKDQKEKGDPNK